MAALTEWEKDHLEGVRLLVRSFCKHEHELEISASVTEDRWNVFRYALMDLYSVLDYTWYFLYCHFSNNGDAESSSRKVIHLSFPFVCKGVKVVQGDPLHVHDGRRKFVDDKSELILQKSIASMWFAGAIGAIILEPQPKCDTNISGQSTHVPMLPQPNSSEESLTLLHYYRNCVTHRQLVHIEKTTMYVKVNRATRETKIVEHEDSDIECFYLPLQEGDWIKIPEDLVREGEHGYRTLKEVLSQLKRFVVGMVVQLLFAAQVFSDDAEADGVERLYTELKSHLLGPLPIPPIKLPLPVVKIVFDDRKNCQQMVNELKQQMSKVCKDFGCEWCPNGDGQTSGLHLSCGSYKQEFNCKGTSQKAKELAAKNAILHFLRLGLLKFTSCAGAPLASSTIKSTLEHPIVILHKSQQQTYTQLLKELIDKNSSQNFDIQKEQDTFKQDETEAQVYHCTITLKLTELNGKHSIYVATGKGKGKQNAKEAASEQSLSKLSSWIRVERI